MAYETGGANDTADLISKIVTFAQTIGWTYEGKSPLGDSGAEPIIVATGGARGSFYGNASILSKNGLVFAFFTSSEAGVDTDPGSFIGAAILPEVPQPNLILEPEGTRSEIDSPITSASSLIGAGNSIAWTSKMSGPYQAYHFFGDQNYIHIVVEVTPGSFRHFGIGQVEKAGAVVDGTYASATRWSFDVNDMGNIFDISNNFPFDAYGTSIATMLRADSDSTSPRWVNLNYGSSGQGLGGWRGPQAGYQAGPTSAITRMPPSTLTGRAILTPCLMMVNRPSGRLSMLGSVIDARWMRMDNYAPADIFSIGPDTWKVFPIIRKNGPSGQENSDNYAIAYRVVT